jgi:hypothetical protein
MKLKKYLPIILVVIFMILLVHFVFSNTVKVIGPNYSLKFSSSAVRDCSNSNIKGCLCTGIYIENPGAPKNDVGFPLATNGYDGFGGCGPSGSPYTFKSSDFNNERMINLVYLIAISGLFFVLYRQVSRHKSA